jgi:probable rRNA maturation factor|tara:strand:- start:2005 stop:2466 length:462 start_codon:yes stop_codon:yes gene_type:complete
MIKINAIIRHQFWNKKIPNINSYLQKKIKILSKKIAHLKNTDYEFTLLLSGDKEIKDLNKKFRKKNKTTDVLSFPFYDKKSLSKLKNSKKKIYLGDVAINVNKVKKNRNKEFNTHFNKLWIHGLVHLFGHNHIKDKDFNKMKKLENEFSELIK